MTNVRVVTREKEVELTFEELDLVDSATDNEIVRAAERHLDANLSGLMVSRSGENVLLSPTPIFG